MTGWGRFFDEHAAVYDNNAFTHATEEEVEFLVELLGLPQGAAIFDVGCGTGRHAVQLARRGFAVTGVDLSEEMLRRARLRAASAGVEVDWVCADATTYAPTQPMDAAICLCEGAFGLLGAADDPLDQPMRILQRIGEALRPGAPCILTALNGFAMARRYSEAEAAGGAFDSLTLCERSVCADPEDPDGVRLRERGFVPTELRLLFRLAGLKVDSMWGGTAGRWGRRRIELDEMEIMVVGRKAVG